MTNFEFGGKFELYWNVNKLRNFISRDSFKIQICHICRNDLSFDFEFNQRFFFSITEVTLMKTNEKRVQRDLSDYRERTKSLEEELHKVKAARSVDDLQRKELEEQLEAEQYFTTLYKTQV